MSSDDDTMSSNRNLFNKTGKLNINQASDQMFENMVPADEGTFPLNSSGFIGNYNTQPINFA